MKTLAYALLTGIFISTIAFSYVSANEGYVIGDEDMLQISVWGNSELTVHIPVRPDGMISVPLIGDVKASGLTPHELKKILEKEFSNFVKAPTVSVIVTAVNSFKVYVFGGGIGAGMTGGASATATSGSTNSSGMITLRSNTSLMQLLAQLGSLGNADLNSSYVLRDGKRLNVDFFKLMIAGDITQDIQLRPKDIIFIPDNFEKRIKVVGAVRTPGVIPFKEGMTALDAILNSGGFTEFAKQNDVVIVRKKGSEVSSIEAKLKDVIKDGDITKDVILKPGDMVIVKTGIF
ncbi:MAG: polysaccharide biosynthesis/export family protein [Nitrospirota bacterium]